MAQFFRGSWRKAQRAPARDALRRYGGARKSRVAQLAPYHNATRYTPSPDITSQPAATLAQTTRHIAHHSPDQGRPWQSPATFEGGGPQRRGLTAASRLGGNPQRPLCTSSVTRCNSASTAWAASFRNSHHGGNDVVRSVVIGTRCIIGAWAEFFSLSQASSDCVAYIPSAAPKRMSAALGP
ncbi:hypothetical protein GWK47_045190 [Chionoecetes opilio]|uniref:Uncharacterized protein n=1 Tax=Chionoecetes opilio TaxID=41210 RepID=A0A8J4YE71_CHIOP|nr:hypothetical protein GWK47_045190 [Chionoecetes opilio]